MEEKNIYKRLFFYVLVILILLSLASCYIFLVKPKIEKYILNIKYETEINTAEIVVSSIVEMIKQQGYVEITYQNKTLILVPYTMGVEE